MRKYCQREKKLEIKNFSCMFYELKYCQSSSNLYVKYCFVENNIMLIEILTSFYSFITNFFFSKFLLVLNGYSKTKVLTTLRTNPIMLLTREKCYAYMQ